MGCGEYSGGVFDEEMMMMLMFFRVGRAIGSYAAGLLVIRRALVMPEEHWYVLGPIGLFFLGSTMLADAVWPVARYLVEQKTAGSVKEVAVVVGKKKQ